MVGDTVLASDGWREIEIKMQTRRSGVGILLARMAVRMEAAKTPN